MPLSEYEQRVLEQMERQLSSDDPKLVNTFQGRSSGVKRWLLIGGGALLGLALLVVGAATSRPIVGVLGFIAMFAAVVFAFSPPRRRGPAGVVGHDGAIRPQGKRKGGPAAGPAGFLARLEERWERRRDTRGQ